MAQWEPPVKTLFFDVFGTCVDWRTTVTDELYESAQAAANSDSSSIDDDARSKASQMVCLAPNPYVKAPSLTIYPDLKTREQWADIAQSWRNTYLVFTRRLAADDPTVPYRTVDEHHLSALQDLLAQHNLTSLYTPPQLQHLSLTWHRLAPWPDTVAGLHALNARFATSTLSNGNLTLLRDMCAHAGMPFTHICSAESFQSYKPSPKVYLGAAAARDCAPAECAMVAAHLDDLKAAKALGLRTVYVRRPREERYPELEAEGHAGMVDVWVEEGEGGFEEVARRLIGEA
nr:(s)-2-haloacid dehalogenase 1 [Quercus suber]